MAQYDSMKQAAIAHYDAQTARAKANLEVYFSRSVGVGEHSDILEEVLKWVEAIEHAEGCIAVLNALDYESD